MPNSVDAPSVEVTLMSLPEGLHIRIQNELLRDPDTNFDHYKKFRLVCKTFERLWTPIVSAHLVLFPLSVVRGEDLFERLCHLVKNEDHRTQFKTLTLCNWAYLKSGLRHFIDIVKLRWHTNQSLSLMLEVLELIILSPIRLVKYLAKPELPRRFKGLLNRNRVKRYAAKLPREFQLPNVNNAQIYCTGGDGRWVINRSIRLLASLPQLTELHLHLHLTADMPLISRRLANLHNLKKLALWVERNSKNKDLPGHSISRFRTVIASNPKLTDLILLSDVDCTLDLDELFGDVPDEKPLRLEHVSIDSYSKHLSALVPHIQSLQSFDFQSKEQYRSKNEWCSVLSKAGVFPPAIKADQLDWELVEYLKNHPGISSLSIGHGGQYSMWCDGLSQVISKHSDKLQWLGVGSHTLAGILKSVELEVNLLLCTNLREILIESENTESIENEKMILHVIARFSRSLTVVIRCPGIHRFKECVDYCRHSGSPLVRNLAGRLVFERHTGWHHNFRIF